MGFSSAHILHPQLLKSNHHHVQVRLEHFHSAELIMKRHNRRYQHTYRVKDHGVDYICRMVRLLRIGGPSVRIWNGNEYLSTDMGRLQDASWLFPFVRWYSRNIWWEIPWIHSKWYVIVSFCLEITRSHICDERNMCLRKFQCDPIPTEKQALIQSGLEGARM